MRLFFHLHGIITLTTTYWVRLLNCCIEHHWVVKIIMHVTIVITQLINILSIIYTMKSAYMDPVNTKRLVMKNWLSCPNFLQESSSLYIYTEFTVLHVEQNWTTKVHTVCILSVCVRKSHRRYKTKVDIAHPKAGVVCVKMIRCIVQVNIRMYAVMPVFCGDC